MPIEHINKTDTLNEGREKLNSAIDGANAADVTSQEADTKATQALANSESTQTQLDTIVIDGDSSVEAAQARVDEKGDPHPTLKARIDDGMNSVNQQLAQIVTNVKTLGATGNGVDSDVPAILEGSKDGVTLGFPDGTYVIDSHVLFEDKKIKWVALGNNVTFLDTGIPVTLDNNNSNLVPHSIKFKNCDVIFEGFEHVNNQVGSGMISEQDEDKIKPYLDFEGGTVEFRKTNMNGRVQPWYKNSPIQDPSLNNPAYEIMNTSYVRFYNCDYVLFEHNTTGENFGGGELYGFNKVKHLKILDNISKQDGASSTFWSYAKAIDCDFVEFNGAEIESNSPGSLIDLSGKKITVENINLDYPAGGFVDVTQEWGYGNIENGSYEIKNSHINSTLLAYNSLGSGANVKATEKVVIDNVTYPSEMIRSPRINLQLTKEIEIKNYKFKNSEIINNMYAGEEHVNTVPKINMLIENSEIIATNDVTDVRTLLETKGLTLIKGCYINMNFLRSIRLFDRSTTPINLEQSNGLVIFEDCVIENTVFDYRANAIFRNCQLTNVFHEVTSTSGAKVILENSPTKLTHMTPENKNLFLLNSFHDIQLINSPVSGNHANTSGVELFRISSTAQKTGDIQLLNSPINVRRVNAIGNYIAGSLLFIVNNEHTLSYNIIIDNISFKNTNSPFSFTGGASSGEHTKKVILRNSLLPEGRLYLDNFTSGDSIEFVVVGNELTGHPVSLEQIEQDLNVRNLKGFVFEVNYMM